ncbi:MAG: precorrin-4 C(11)-methyltransferase [Desulfovibrio sp.]|jgi:precorrin-4/cobalt-precorrin-4 C11-methyltransferase|nr:precorrin-4 C(11)-methyltransferase [Desulfovibrio sp.]
MPGLVTFVGAGPGDPELITVKGRLAIEAADLVFYTGSLVPAAVVSWARKDARLEDSSPLTLEEGHALTRDVALKGGHVARVHTGDPSLYGALREQAELLDRDGIPWRVIPGVTAACAAAAAAGIAFTVPQVTQSLVITRAGGRTPMPETEKLRLLAAHKSSLAVYLGGRAAESVREELLAVLPSTTPVLCAHRVGQPEERLVWTDVDNMARCVAERRLESQTIFLVLPGEEKKGARSCLYDPAFSHSFRPFTKT